MVRSGRHATLICDRILAFDTETVALPSGTRYPAICQIGIVYFEAFDDGRVVPVGELDLKLNPEVAPDAWQQDAIAVHGIRPEDVADAPTFFEAFGEIAAMAVGARKLVGFNVEYDIMTLAATLKRYGLEYNFPWPPQHVDVMKMAADRLEALAGKRGNKMPTLTEAFEALVGEPMQGAHDAMADIRATVNLYNILTRR